MKKKRGLFLKTTIILGVALLLGAIFTAVLLEPKFKIYGWEELNETKLTKAERTVNFLDIDDAVIENTIYDSNKTFVSIKEIPKHTVDAFVAIEDKRFYNHHGIDYKRIVGALISNIKTLSFKEGASTISQQLIKNTHLSSDKKISRKIKEIRIAKDLERRYTKDEIMEMYLNILYFGDNMYGINTAAKVYFNKQPKDLSIAQSALIAGIINNPSKYNPYRNPENALQRRNLVLLEMLKNNKITSLQYDEAVREKPIIFEDNKRYHQYLNSVFKDAQEILGISRKELLSEKLTIGTYYEPRLENHLKMILKNTKIPNDADAHIVVLSNGNGRLISDISLKNNNLALLKRQPGSTIKPLLCYAPALETDIVYTVSHIEDKPMSFGEYKPSNYNNKYYGWVTVQEALSKSLNIPAVKLLQSVGIDSAKRICAKFGIEFDANDNNLALALGGMTNGVTLRQLSDGYRVFANQGNYTASSSIRYIMDENKRILYSSDRDRRKISQALSADNAYLMTTMLKKCVEEGTAKKLSKFGNVCAKTGTVGDKNGNSDIYCMAYSPSYTVGVWIGGSNTKMPNNITASNYACEIAGKVFSFLSDTEEFEKPPTVKCRYIDLNELNVNHKVLLAGEDIGLNGKTAAWFSEKNIPADYSTPQYDEYFNYDDFLNLDFDNFEIIQNFFD